jgi:hypothetical protein
MPPHGAFQDGADGQELTHRPDRLEASVCANALSCGMGCGKPLA